MKSKKTKSEPITSHSTIQSEPIASRSPNQINQDKSSATFKLVVASFSNNNALSFNDKSSSFTFKLGVEFNLILHSEGARAPSFALIVGYRSSKISFHFCNNCRIFCEGVKEQINDGDANIKQCQISLDDLISFIGLGVSFIGGFIGFIGLGLVSIAGLIGLISLGELGIISLVGSLASSASRFAVSPR